MVDFKSTIEDSKGIVRFYTDKGAIAAIYGAEQIIEYARKEFLKDWIREFEESGREFNPMKYKYQETFFGKFEQYVLEEGIDENWHQVTEQFYNSLNKSEYKSQNLPQQTKAQTV